MTEPHPDLNPEPPYWLLQLANRRTRQYRTCRHCGSSHAPGDTMTYRVELVDTDFLYGYECVSRCEDHRTAIDRLPTAGV